MTCKQLGGFCDTKFSAETFDEIVRLSQTHGQEMYQKNDAAHIAAMQKMQTLMQDPERMQAWLQEKRKIFDKLESTSS